MIKQSRPDPVLVSSFRLLATGILAPAGAVVTLRAAARLKSPASDA